ncbi:MAG: IS66 family insertion sequence element accessory protein TnpB [Lachnospiraceae bacterium]|nr:IS66 family insertion sequence element accessory protein TnpB [Lachnospiraceae bacterium]
MDKITHEVRISHWKQVVEQCQARPEGQSAKQWLAENGISSKTYYYWLRKIRKLAYEQSASNTTFQSVGAGNAVATVATEPEAPVSFAEIPFSIGNESSSGLDSCFQPATVIKMGRASIAFSNGASPELVASITREVLNHA